MVDLIRDLILYCKINFYSYIFYAKWPLSFVKSVYQPLDTTHNTIQWTKFEKDLFMGILNMLLHVER